MPWSMSNPPPPAKNWSPAKKRRCIAAGNAALRSGKSEEDAIYACIGAAKNVKQKIRVSESRIKIYQQEEDAARTHFATYAQEFLDGSTLENFQQKMQRELKSFYIRTALLAKGQEPFTNRDKTDLARFLGMAYGYLDEFVGELQEYKNKALASDQGVIHRSSSYGYGWGVFSRFTLPGELADILPELPGLSCLGGEKCGCILEYDFDGHEYHVYWYVNPFKAHCVICADLAIEWDPYVVTIEDLIDEYGDEVLDADGNFVEF